LIALGRRPQRSPQVCRPGDVESFVGDADSGNESDENGHGESDEMGEVIKLAERRRRRTKRTRRVAAATPTAEFLFDLACPFTYLAAERVDRAFARVRWRPACGASLTRRSVAGDSAAERRLREAAEHRAAQLRMPLVWPERFPADVPAAMRVATLAAERGRGAAFTLAASRLAYCGGFDLEDPEIIAEAAAAAGLSLDECLAAARDVGRDGSCEAAGRRLLAAGADRLPALRVGRALFWGEDRVAEAAAVARQYAAAAIR
jgi:2-hydroxychromene-2-carboxylate isomerase